MARLVFVNRFYRPDESATSQLLTDLAERLAAEGHEVHVVCSRLRYDGKGAPLLARERIAGVEVHRAASSGFGRAQLVGRAVDYLSFYAAAGWLLLRLVRAGDVLVAKTDPPMLSVLCAPIARLRRARLVNWLQDLFPEVATELGVGLRPQWLGRLLRALRNASLAAACANVVLGERMRRRVAALGVAAERIQVIENWAEPLHGAPAAAADSALRIAAGLRAAFVVGYSGNLGRAHETETLLDAARRLADVPDVAFVMIGGGAGMEQLRRQVSEQGLTNFRFLPYQPRSALADSLAAPDVHLVSLRPAMEGLIVPSKIYGILAAARPTLFIGDPEGDVAQLLRDADCGICVPCGDGAGLARQIIALRDDVARRLQLGRNARVAFAHRGSFEHALRAWHSMLCRVAPDRTREMAKSPPGQSGT